MKQHSTLLAFSSTKLKSDMAELIESVEWQCENNTEFINGYRAAMADIWYRTTGTSYDATDSLLVPVETEVPF